MEIFQNLVATTPTKNASEYRLPDADRQAILSGSDSYRLRSDIDRQRTAFMAQNGGDPFGEKETSRAAKKSGEEAAELRGAKSKLKTAKPQA